MANERSKKATTAKKPANGVQVGSTQPSPNIIGSSTFDKRGPRLPDPKTMTKQHTGNGQGYSTQKRLQKSTPATNATALKPAASPKKNTGSATNSKATRTQKAASNKPKSNSKDSKPTAYRFIQQQPRKPEVPPSRDDDPTDDDPTDEESQLDQDDDEGDLEKQLVKWAGRLEFESIDLRDKSKGLIAELMENSEELRLASGEIKEGVVLIQKIVNQKLVPSKTVTEALVKLESTVKAIESRTEKLATEQASLTKAVLLKNEDGKSKKAQQDVGDNAQKTMKLLRDLSSRIETIVKFQELKSRKGRSRGMRGIDDEEGIDGTMKETLIKCNRRLEDITNLQIDFNVALKHMVKTQENFSLQLETMNAKLEQRENTRTLFTPGNSSAIVSTPENIIHNQANKFPTQTQNKRSSAKVFGYEARFQSRKRVRQILLIHDKNTDGDTFINLLSDEILPDL